jgi:hypothetical protein
MTLYGYVRTKDELLACFADRFYEKVELPADAVPGIEDCMSQNERSGHVSQ